MNKVETDCPQGNSPCCHRGPPVPEARCSLKLEEMAFAFLRQGFPGKMAVAVVAVAVAVGTSVVEGTSAVAVAVAVVVVVERDHYSQLDRIEGMAFDRR